MESISLKGVSDSSKILLLKELGYDSDGQYVIDEHGERVKDKYIDEPIELENMLVFPGSTVVLDNNPLSIAAYFEEYGDE